VEILPLDRIASETVRFDDRLTTVLEQPAATAHDRAIRWRQLVELVARAPGEASSDLTRRALDAIRTDRELVEERVRIAAALAVASIPFSSELVALFAEDRLTVAAPILASARLTASEWRQVTLCASEESRAFIAAMRSDERTASAPATPHSDTSGPIPSISEVVARIERLRNMREIGPETAPIANAQSPRLFRWECNEAGQIDWIDGAPRGALVGQSIAQARAGAGVDRSVERAFASRAPFHDGLLDLPRDATIGGTWKISGIPAFERSSGRFAGYRGVAQRAAEGVIAADPTPLRELVHEIKTPLNAIIGFAEIINGEYLGPADSAYRQRAGEIVTQARLLLSAIEDLDFAARTHSGNNNHARTNIGELAETMIGRLREIGASRNIKLEASRTTGALVAKVDREVAERLIQRMVEAVIARASEGETLRLGVDPERDRCMVWISRPAALAGLAEQDLFGSAEDALSEEFPLRLARGLAHSAGADIIVSPAAVCLSFASA
jgi:signal transduction histidine kinase